MTALQKVLREYSEERLSQGEVDLEPRLEMLSKDLRFGYFFQLTIVSLIFLLTMVAISVSWHDSTAIASFLGALGIGGVGWFLRVIRASMREYAFVQLLIGSSHSLSQEQLDALIDIVKNGLSDSASNKQ